MSNTLLNAAWKAQLSAAEKFVLVALADFADEARECFPSIPMLMERCSMSDRGVQKQLVALIAHGYLERDFRKGRSTIYRITDPRTWFTPNDVHPEHGSPQPRTTFTPERGSPPNDVHPTPEPGSGTPEPRSPITITYPSSNPHSHPSAIASTPDTVPEVKAHVLAAKALIAAGIPAARMDLSHPDLLELSALHPVEVFAKAGALAVHRKKPHLAYALSIVRNGADDAQREAPGTTNTAIPPVNASFKDQDYVGTPVEHLPAEFREAAAGVG